MHAHEFILVKQIQWAINHGIPLIGSKGNRGRPAYTAELNKNLFEPLSAEVYESFEQGDGNEISGNPAKMQALHSSSALGVNVFHYWKRIRQVSVIASACGFCRKGSVVSEKLVFEDKYQIDDRFQLSPNIDVVFHNSDSSQFKRFAVECKFSEAYSSRKHGGLKRAYFDLPLLWQDIPALHKLAKSISPNDNLFEILHPAQLIKHILGLKAQFGKNGFRLLYLWYDVPAKEGAFHRDEIEKFIKVTKADDIHFHAMSYQELITTLSQEYRDKHPEYLKYLSDRYL
jgi:hypothetical protein